MTRVSNARFLCIASSRRGRQRDARHLAEFLKAELLKQRLQALGPGVAGDKLGEVMRARQQLALAAARKLSECAPLFLAAYRLRGAGAVLHSHSVNALLATLAFEGDFRVTHLEMMKGIRGHGYHDELRVPIIRNTARECELTESLTAAIEAHPKTQAVLVERHGVYVWGRSWAEAKTQAECYDYLFEAAVKMKQLGLDPAAAPERAAAAE